MCFVRLTARGKGEGGRLKGESVRGATKAEKQEEGEEEEVGEGGEEGRGP